MYVHICGVLLALLVTAGLKGKPFVVSSGKKVSFRENHNEFSVIAWVAA